MITYRQEKTENAICYLIRKHKEIVNKPTFKTFLFKYIALFDFTVLKETGRPALELEYRALPNGPVPIYYYDDIESIESELFIITEDENGNHVFDTEKIPDLDYFSEIEMNILERVAKKYMKRNMFSQTICDITHEEIQSWKSAWGRRTSNREPMYYDDTFPLIHEKLDSELSAEEEVFLTYKASIQF